MLARVKWIISYFVIHCSTVCAAFADLCWSSPPLRCSDPGSTGVKLFHVTSADEMQGKPVASVTLSLFTKERRQPHVQLTPTHTAQAPAVVPQPFWPAAHIILRLFYPMC